MNANFALTDTPGRRRRSFSQELGFHFQFAVLSFEFAEPGAVRDRQRWFLVGVVESVLVDPAPESSFVHLDFSGDLGDRPGRLDHHLHGLVFELRRELPTPFSHRSSSVPGRTLLGPVSGIWEARQPGRVGRAARCQRGAGPFPRGLPPNRTCPFPSIRLSSDYCVSGVAGCPVWMWSWQAAQTTRVLRRRLRHELRPCRAVAVPGWSRSASLRTWWTCTLSVCLQISHLSREEPGDQLLVRVDRPGSGRGR